MRYRCTTLLAGALLLAACNGTMDIMLDPPQAPRDSTTINGFVLKRDTLAYVQTNGLSYTFKVDNGYMFSAKVPFTFHNPLADTIYIVNCRGGLALSLEAEEAGQWKRKWSPALRECLSPPIRIPPHSVYTDTARIWGAIPGYNTYPQFEMDQPEGVYRLRWSNLVLHYHDYRPNTGWGDAVPAQITVSNRFFLDDPRNNSQ